MWKNITFRHRRLLALALTLIAILTVRSMASLIDSRLGRSEILTGSTVLGSLFLLVLLGVRRRLPFLPLGNVSTWTQIHIYTGIFAGGVYALHVPSLIADGRLEFALSLLFMIVTFSGFYGVFVSRTLPKKLSTIESQPRFDLVPWHRQQIQVSAQSLLDGIREKAAEQVLSVFYNSNLRPFFSSRPSLAFVVAPNTLRRKRLLYGLQQLDRYLESEGRETVSAFAALVRKRDELDYQYALQLRLRLWVVVHGFFSLLLIALSVAHAFVAMRFLS